MFDHGKVCVMFKPYFKQSAHIPELAFDGCVFTASNSPCLVPTMIDSLGLRPVS